MCNPCRLPALINLASIQSKWAVWPHYQRLRQATSAMHSISALARIIWIGSISNRSLLSTNLMLRLSSRNVKLIILRMLLTLRTFLMNEIWITCKTWPTSPALRQSKTSRTHLPKTTSKTSLVISIFRSQRILKSSRTRHLRMTSLVSRIIIRLKTNSRTEPLTVSLVWKISKISLLKLNRLASKLISVLTQTYLIKILIRLRQTWTLRMSSNPQISRASSPLTTLKTRSTQPISRLKASWKASKILKLRMK